MLHLLLALLLLSLSIRVSASFYDNPEQDPLPDSPEELHRKWDFEVVLCSSFPWLYLFFLSH